MADVLYRARLPEMRKNLAYEAMFFDPQPVIHRFTKMGGKTAAQVMTSHPIVIDVDAPLESAINLMIDRKLKSIPVVRGNKLVGIISRIDVMKQLMVLEKEIEKHPLTDEEITEITKTLLTKWMGSGIQNLQVTIHEGKISLSGEIDSSKEIDAIQALVKSIRGVKDVECNFLVTSLLH